MRSNQDTRMLALATLGLGAMLVILVRLFGRNRERVALREEAIQTLRSSGEYFFRHEPTGR